MTGCRPTFGRRESHPNTPSGSDLIYYVANGQLGEVNGCGMKPEASLESYASQILCEMGAAGTEDGQAQ